MSTPRVGDRTDLPQRVPPSVRAGAPLVERKCLICGRHFLVPESLAARYTACSRVCSTARRQRRADPNARVAVECAWCGAETVKWRNDVKQTNYCSNECRMDALNNIPREHRDGTGRTITPKGYVRVIVYSPDGKRRSVMEHRWVMEKVIGRTLTRTERVHHIDGDRANNAPDNLLLFASQEDHIRAMHPELAQNLGCSRGGLSMTASAIQRRERRRAQAEKLAPVKLAWAV